MNGRDRLPVALLAAGTVALVASGIRPYDRFTWLLEVLPAIIAAPILVATYRRFRLTDLAYVLIAIHAVILMAGGHWTYARVPLGNWMQHAFGLARNDYDRIGHLAQGFVPAVLTREILLRRTALVRGAWLFFLVTSVCLAISACYELVEWGTAVAAGSAATDFLGTQGDVWDTQSDMLMAGIGAVAAQLLLSRWHDRQLARLPGFADAPPRPEAGP
jgi:putative membrane protein